MAALLAGGGARPAAAFAQGTARTTLAAGRIGRLGATASDTLAVSGARVLLHEVGLARQGPIDSAATDARGRFRFRFRPDSGALYLVSARHDGIEYFSAPLAATPERPDTGIAVVVADTSSDAAVTVAARRIAITRPGDNGGRNVLDLLTLRNGGRRTRVAPDTVRPAWSVRLPAGIDSLEVGQGDFSPEAVSWRGGSVLVFAPIAPGEKQLTIDYRLPVERRTIAIGFAERVPVVDLLVEEPQAKVSGLTSVTVDTPRVENREFRRWRGAVGAGDTIRVDFGRIGPAVGERWILIVLVALVTMAFVIAARRYRVLAR